MMRPIPFPFPIPMAELHAERERIVNLKISRPKAEGHTVEFPKTRLTRKTLIASNSAPLHHNLHGQIGEDWPLNITAFDKLLNSLPPTHPFVFNLETEGGDLDQAFLMAKRLLRHDGIVKFHVPSFCDSAGLILLATGDYRTCSTKADFRFHNPAYPKRLTASELKRSLATLEQKTSDMATHIAKGCGQPKTEIQRLQDWGSKLDASTAKHLGLINEIK